MPHVQSHPAGKFCWIELGTTDQSAAKAFYSSLFGWTVQDQPIGPNSVYTLFKTDGRTCAAAYAIEDKDKEIPPHWMLYIAVENADETAEAAVSRGGKIVEGPFDVFTYGRMAVLRDPTGAVFCAWQAKQNPGIGIEGVPGTFCWAELSTPEPSVAAAFYSGLFNWTIHGSGEKYLEVDNNGTRIGGIPAATMRDPSAPPHWLAYFATADCDATVANAVKLGGKVIFGPMTMEGVGRMAYVADPQGAIFALYQAQR